MKSSVVTRSEAQKSKIQTRSMGRGDGKLTRAPNRALLEAKKIARQNLNGQKSETIAIRDIYQTVMDSVNLVRGETGLVFDRRMAEHRCEWDDNYPECPERLTRVLDRCAELQLIERCLYIEPRCAIDTEIFTKHTTEHFEKLKATDGCTDLVHLEDLSSHFDAIFINSKTYELSMMAVGCTIELVDNILLNKVQNGMAIIRPPGHHAMKSEFNGYCFFNNVALAAQHALDKRNVNRILIVDWDVHHGQGTQRMFYDDDRVLYFSIHRYEHGTFWPNLRESDYDAIGKENGKGYNFNVPLNKTGMTNADYLAIFQQILMPVAIEFQPELVIVSAGYDAAYGCQEFTPELVIVSAGYDSAWGDEKGEMEVMPACYAHLLSPLMTLAQGRVAVILEGGYCLSSLSEGAALTLKRLLGDPCPQLEQLSPPCDSIQETIFNCIYAHKPYWKCLHLQETFGLEELNNINPQPNLHQVVTVFKGGPPIAERFETRNCYPVQSSDFIREIESRLASVKSVTDLYIPPNRVCFVYDDLMTGHQNLFEDHPECPDRIIKINDRFMEFDLVSRMHKISSRLATVKELCMAHSSKYVDEIRAKLTCKEDLKELGEAYNSVYFHETTLECALLAVGSVLQVVDSVLQRESQSGVCVVRPPGHHAESDLPHGFCIFNNVAVAAQYAIETYNLSRVLIVDWDVHHGNGTQHIFEANPKVLYVSVHRYDNASFFPKSKDANYTEVGCDAGEGFNVNIPWNKRGMGDADYFSAFQTIIMPIAYEFRAELVLVSAGFDAAVGDPLGGCNVTPEAYGHLTHWLSALANGRIILCLEGGYNVNSIAYAMTACTKALLGDPLSMVQTAAQLGPATSCIQTLQEVASVQSKYWSCLRFNKKLPASVDTERTSEQLMDQFANMNLQEDCLATMAVE